jgi:hypothetical protein
MKSLFPVAVVTALLVAGSTPVLAAESAAGGLGFRANAIHTPNASELRLDAPVGVRWWLGPQKVGVDLGVGYASHHDDLADKNTSDWSLDVGIPIALKSWERVRVIARPGINYTSQEDYVPGSTAGTTEKITDKFTTVTGEVEAEVFLLENVSLSASEGIGWVSYDPGESGEKTTTDFTTFGRNFTSVGFHVYLWGAK